jgi:RNA polymerase sigma-70 factor, ECF subfamily
MAEPLTIESQKALMLLMTQHQRRILSYIYTLMPDRHAAEDILQETSVVVCEKFHLFRLGSDFVAWACQIAYWEVRRARQKYARSKVVFDDTVLEAVSQTAVEMADELDPRHEALQGCLKKLHARDREFILERYERGHGVEQAAKNCGRSMLAAYKALTRIRKSLLDCVTYTLNLEANP